MLSGSPRRLVEDAVMLIGDAAWLAYPQSGEGIRPAVDSGLLAARNIAAAHGSYSRSTLADYGLQIAGQASWSARIGVFLPQACIGILARQLLRRHWFVRNVVLDQWFLAGGRPSHPSPALAASVDG